MNRSPFRGMCLGTLITLLLLSAGASASKIPGIPDGCSTRCHQSKVREQFVHGPVKADDCIACHQPVGGEHPKDRGVFRLAGEREKLCYLCHEGKGVKRVVHPPVAEGDCLACHDPHQSPYAKQLKALGSELCFKCHDPAAFRHKHGHAPVASGNCLGCHDPHQSDNRSLLKADGAGLCFRCHDKKLAAGASIHKPVAEGKCVRCHAPHGSDWPKLLRSTFPEPYYLPYARDNFALCFDCHNKNLAQDRRTDTLTGFRNGDFNLHYRHVNKSDRGRSCKTCHDPHAASQPRLIKEQIPGFGDWEIPIRYTKTETGGTCVVGCHKPKSYDRVRPVTNP
ncbi:cytochrome c3 family protein [Geobacter sp.]|uniref:cytochrome c3 family protein n=1 Tax=Geobacter sp. TaxID=46610 RepID=UPI002620A6D8|nr:cytochrome c3 family protein [Geobacter sp.]